MVDFILCPESTHKTLNQDDLQEENKRLRKALARAQQERDIHSLLCERNPLKYPGIKAHQAKFEVSLLWKLLGVSRGCYYSWYNALPSARAKSNERVSEKMKKIFNDSRQTC